MLKFIITSIPLHLVEYALSVFRSNAINLTKVFMEFSERIKLKLTLSISILFDKSLDTTFDLLLSWSLH